MESMILKKLDFCTSRASIKNSNRLIPNLSYLIPPKIVIKYKNPFPIDETHPDYNPRIPTFAKTSNSDVYYAAGWYCINFDKAWKHGNCPKLSTLLEYGYEGPFANKIECRRRLRELNREKRSIDQS